VRTRPAVTLTALVAVVVFAACSGDPARESQSSSGPGVDDRVAEAVDSALAGDPTLEAVRAVLVVVDGEPLLERYAGTTAEEFHPVASVTKAVVSTMVGTAVEDGLLDLDDTLAEMLPHYAEQMGPGVAKVTLEELLTMRGGVIANDDPDSAEIFTAPDVVAAALASGRGATGDFGYSGAGAHLVAAILAEATGGSVLDYAREVLFDPLGVDTEPSFEPGMAVPAAIPEYMQSDFAWPVDPQGIHEGANLLKLRPRDMAARGQLYLDQGRWQGKQVVPAEWVEQATSSHVMQGEDTVLPEFPGYGYFWDVGKLANRDAFMAIGHGGQLVAVVPELELVAVMATELDQSDLSTDLTLGSARNVIEAAIVEGFGRRPN